MLSITFLSTLSRTVYVHCADRRHTHTHTHISSYMRWKGERPEHPHRELCWEFRPTMLPTRVEDEDAKSVHRAHTLTINLRWIWDDLWELYEMISYIVLPDWLTADRFDDSNAEDPAVFPPFSLSLSLASFLAPHIGSVRCTFSNSATCSRSSTIVVDITVGPELFNSIFFCAVSFNLISVCQLRILQLFSQSQHIRPPYSPTVFALQRSLSSCESSLNLITLCRFVCFSNKITWNICKLWFFFIILLICMPMLPHARHWREIKYLKIRILFAIVFAHFAIVFCVHIDA